VKVDDGLAYSVCVDAQTTPLLWGVRVLQQTDCWIDIQLKLLLEIDGENS